MIRRWLSQESKSDRAPSKHRRFSWKTRVGVTFLLAALLWASRGVWLRAVGESLVCEEGPSQAGALFLDNLDPDYLVFERAATMRRLQPELRVLVPVPAASPGEPSRVEYEIAGVMAGVAHLSEWEAVVFDAVEPISLHAAYKVRDRLLTLNFRSVVLLSPALRSRRTLLVYDSVLTRAGISVSCVPVFGRKTPSTWFDTWHGVQEVVLQSLKLQYYRLWVLPRET
jgi:hypothetical protein